ncbi:ABC transporter permease [Roseivirga pacifica]|uniref:ABC transporter permease n=1 Tax=Roseivirga pacifica TaxID=1267423 RepID=UPI003BAFD3B6
MSKAKEHINSESNLPPSGGIQGGTPPRLAEKLLLWFLKDELAEEVLGDLDEKFYSTSEKYPIRKARRNYWYQVINYLRPFALKSTKVKNLVISPMKIHFKFATRVFRKNSLITFASLTSIVVGVLSTFLIYQWLNSELTTDQFHSNYDRLYTLAVQQSAVDNLQPISSDFFNIDYGEFSEIDGYLEAIYFEPDQLKIIHNNKDYEAAGLVTDSTFFNFFNFKLIDGTPELLKDPSNIILTESLAERIFGDNNPIGKTLVLNQRGNFQIAGILENIPSNSSISFDYIVPKHAHDFWGKMGMEFLLTNGSFNKAEFNEKIKELGRTHPQFKESTLSTIPFKDIYFNHSLTHGLLAKYGDEAEIKTLTLVAIVILLVAVLNFTNMQSTLLFSQMKSKGIKQIHGAGRIDFFLEILASRLLYTVVSIPLIFGAFLLIKPNYLRFLELTLSSQWLETLGLIAIGTSGFVILTTIISLLQSTRISAPKAIISEISTRRNTSASKILTTVQYVFAIVLIIATGVVFKQFQYMQNKDLGYNPNNLVSVKFFDGIEYTGDFEVFKKQSEDQVKSYEYVKNELGKIPGIESFTQGALPLSNNVSAMSWKLSNSDFEYTEAKLLTADPAYFNTMDLKLLNGRFFSDSLDTERQHKVVINKAAMEYWGIDNTENAKLANSSWSGEKAPWQVIGVVDNFNFEHLSRKVEPLIMVYFEDVEREFSFRIREGGFKPTMEAVAGLFQGVNPNRDFNYTILDDQLAAQYERERKLSRTFVFFTLIALILSSIGLFTMALYETQKRIKEIGIRKVIGASVGQVVTLLSSSFMKWVLIAFVIATPIAWYAMNEWLANFANQTNISWWIFAAAGILAMILAMATVIGQSLTAAKRNPVHSLRHD